MEDDAWIGSWPLYTSDYGPNSLSIVDFYSYRINEKNEVEVRIQGIEMVTPRNICYTKIIPLKEIEDGDLFKNIILEDIEKRA